MARAEVTSLRTTKEAARLMGRPSEQALWVWARARGVAPERTVQLGSARLALWDMTVLYDAEHADQVAATTPATAADVYVEAAGMEWPSTNRRDHWSKRARLTRGWRVAAALAARRARLQPVPGPVRIEATVHKATARRYDLDGVTPTVKACVDGLRDAGVLVEDDTTAAPELLLRAGEKCPGRPGIALLLVPVG